MFLVGLMSIAAITTVSQFGGGMLSVLGEQAAAIAEVQEEMEEKIAIVRFEPKATSTSDGDETSSGFYAPDPLNRITQCEPYRDFGYGFQETQVDVQIPVRGNVLGDYFKVAIDKKDPDTAFVEKIETLGSSDDVFLLGIEYDGVNEFFKNHDRVSVFSLEGVMVITRALMKVYAEDDIRQGDDYVIGHNKGFIIDINGLEDREDYVYDSSNQTGENDIGNNDTRLDFHDIGCVIYEDGRIRNVDGTITPAP